MDILDAGGDNRASIRGCAADMRPNRLMKRSTRISKVVRRTGVFNSTANRDRVMGEIEKRRERQKKPWKSAQTQQLAATKIQQIWRFWCTYCWICATITSLTGVPTTYGVPKRTAEPQRSRASFAVSSCEGFSRSTLQLSPFSDTWLGC